MGDEFAIVERDYGLYKTAFTQDQKIGKEQYSLCMGGPGVNLLRASSKFMLKATEKRLANEINGDGDLLQYGSSLGDPVYRINLAKFLSKQYDDDVDVRSIFATSGASAALSLLVSTFFNPGDFVFVEDPTYFLFMKMICIDLGLRTVPIKVDDYGIDVELLRQEIEKRKPDDFQPTAEYPYWALMYAIPVYHNPTGICYSKERCENIVKIAREYNLMVVCDDVYNMLCLEKNGDTFEKAPPRLLKYDVKSDEGYFGNIVSNGSFSKCLGPGLRLGWIEAPTVVLRKIMINGPILSGGGMNHYTSGIVGSSLNTDLFKNYILNFKTVVKENIEAVLEVLEKYCPEGVKYSIPKGGYYIWMKVPQHIDVEELNQQCLETHNVSFLLGKFCSTSGSYKNNFRICFAYYTAHELRQATKKILQVIELKLKKERI